MQKKLNISLKSLINRIKNTEKFKSAVTGLFTILFGVQAIMPVNYNASSLANISTLLGVNAGVTTEPTYPNSFPQSAERPIYTMKIPVTAYNSLPGQTDNTPCFTANDFNLCEHNQEDVIAANFLPFGTRVKIPELFGDRVFTVQDRMNARYSYHADVWMKEYKTASDFGLKYAKIEVYKD